MKPNSSLFVFLYSFDLPKLIGREVDVNGINL